MLLKIQQGGHTRPVGRVTFGAEAGLTSLGLGVNASSAGRGMTRRIPGM